MGVKVRERKPGEWWIYIDHKGQRKAVKVGSEAAAKIMATKIRRGLETGVILKYGNEACDVCFSAHGIEKHHLLPKFEAKRIGQDCKEEIQICANCHRVAHRKWGQNVSYDGPTNRKGFIEGVRNLLMVSCESSDVVLQKEG